MKMIATEPVYCLLVDDLEENLLALEAVLKADHLHLLKARSGNEALELLLQHDVALALLDVQMPGMDGFELAELMRGTERTRSVPIIFLTAGSADTQRRFRGYEAGAVDFLHKPLEPDILRSKAGVFFALDRQHRVLSRQRDALQASAEVNAKLLSESRQYAAALQEADRKKDEFLANMSHEIRTPMNAVIGLANILDSSSPLTPRQKEFIATLKTSAASLLGLINDLLDISKIEASPVVLDHTPFSVVRVVQDAVKMMEVRAAEKGLGLHIDQRCPDVDIRAYLGDPARLRQIVLNLISNAIKFTEEGNVTVIIHCDDTDDAAVERVTLEIRDTGIGIPPDKLDSVFQKFVQADSSINRKYGGTGLGLTITKTLTELMGGKIKVSSELGKGSCFSVELPLTRTSAQILEPTRSTSMPLGSKARQQRILLVEDHPPNVLVARTYLEDFGYKVDVATNGEEAVAMATKQPYATVLMDVQMPGMDGFAATAQIRKFERDHGLEAQYIIGMTAHALIGDRERCLNAGMDDYITKPFNPDELEEKISGHHLARDHA